MNKEDAQREQAPHDLPIGLIEPAEASPEMVTPYISREHFDRAFPAEKQDAWQPISTAPKDGREIILYSPPLPSFSIKHKNIRIAWYVIGRIEADNFWGTEVFFDGRSIVQHIHHATHWMPLPKGPTQ